MIKEIKSKDNKLIKYALKLQNTKFSKEEGKFLIESEHLIEMAEQYIDTIFITEKHFCDIYNNCYLIPQDLMDKISQNKSSRNLLAICNFPKEKEINNDIVLFLDDVQDPGNVGTLLRTALSFGITDVILTKGCAYKYGFKTIQSSQGSIFRINAIDGDTNTLKNLKKNGYKVVSTALSSNTIELDKFNFMKNAKYAIILGNEGQGISKDILSLSDYVVKIEMSNIDSLNVGVAGGIVMYKASRR